MSLFDEEGEEEPLFDEEEPEEEYQKEVEERKEYKSIPKATLKEIAKHPIAVKVLRFLKENKDDAFTAWEIMEGLGSFSDHSIRENCKLLAEAGLVINQSGLSSYKRRKNYFILHPRIKQEDIEYIEKWYKRKREALERRHQKWVEGRRKRMLNELMPEL